MVTDVSPHARDGLNHTNGNANTIYLKLSRHLFKMSKFHILLHLIQTFTVQIIYFYRRLNMPDLTCHNCGFDQLRVFQQSMRAQRAAAYADIALGLTIDNPMERHSCLL